MKLGFFIMPVHPTGRDYAQVLKEDRELALIADKLGFAEGFIGEHVTDAAERITSSLVFVASLIGETRNIKLGTGTINMANHHPAAIAAQVAMVDHMAEGRFIMGISPGNLRSDAELFGNHDRDRNDMLVEAMDHVLALWASDPPYDLPGKYWTISTQRTTFGDQGGIPKPYQKPHPPIVVTVVAPHSKGVFVADDLKTARRYATAPEGPYHHYYRTLGSKLIRYGRANLFKADPAAPDSAVTAEGMVDDLVIWGTPDKVVDELLAFR